MTRNLLGAVAACAVVAFAAMAVLTLVLLRPSHAASQAPGSGEPQVVHHTVVDALKSIDPSYAGLTPDQKLEKANASPYFQGIVHGSVGAPVTKKISPMAGSISDIVMDFPFTIRGFLGPDQSPYPVGSTITLRIPGGTIGKERMEVEGAPAITGGQDLYVTLRDPGKILGGNTSTVLIALDGDNVFVQQKGVVHGQGAFATLSESVAIFEQHFARPH